MQPAVKTPCIRVVSRDSPVTSIDSEAEYVIAFDATEAITASAVVVSCIGIQEVQHVQLKRCSPTHFPHSKRRLQQCDSSYGFSVTVTVNTFSSYS